MNRALLAVKQVYRRIAPQWLRQSMGGRSLRNRVFRLLDHQTIYDAEYFIKTVEQPAVQSAPVIADSIVRDLAPRTVIDVGCGTGALLAALQERGRVVSGLEYADAAIDLCRRRRLNVQRFDIESDIYRGDEMFDVAICMEVAEHLPQQHAGRLVELLTSLSNMVVFTAAGPGQDGADHCNLQPPAYWIAKFVHDGFEYDRLLTARWQDDWCKSGVVVGWYYQNLLVFRKASQAETTARAE
jgi:SAM-dependent methyltransferase